MKIATGKLRRPFLIKEWLAGRKIKMVEVAASLGMHHCVVSDTVHGRRNNRKVLRWLQGHGCPEKYLALPEDMKVQTTKEAA